MEFKVTYKPRMIVAVEDLNHGDIIISLKLKYERVYEGKLICISSILKNISGNFNTFKAIVYQESILKICVEFSFKIFRSKRKLCLR